MSWIKGLIIICIGIVAGCSDEPAERICRLRQLNGSFLGDNITELELSYSSERCPKTITITREIAGKITKSNFEVIGCPFTILKNTQSNEQYFFGRNQTDNSIFSIEHEYEDNGISYEDQTLFYYDKGKLDYVTYYIKNASTSADMTYINSSSKNPSYIEYSLGNGQSSVRLAYDYDEYNKPFQTIPELSYLFNQFGENNVTRISRVTESQSLEIISRFTYQYNSQRYPVNIIKDDLANTSLAYNCQ